jgi:hypothetical protein
MGSNVNADGTVIGANSTLNTTRGIRDHMSRRENRVFIHIPSENSQNCHIQAVVLWMKKLRVEFSDYYGRFCREKQITKVTAINKNVMTVSSQFSTHH